MKAQEEEEEEEVMNWCELPNHIIELIMNNLISSTPEISDYIRCSSVCTSWLAVFRNNPLPCLLLPPFLIVPTPPPPPCSNKKKNKKKKTINTKSLSFYNIIHKKVYNQFQVTIPSNRHFRGSSHGWLVAVDQDNVCQVRLFNPFLSSEILLPSLKHLPIDIGGCDSTYSSPSTYAYLTKVVLSDDPLLNPTNYIVMAIFGAFRRLAFYRPGSGEEKWTLVEKYMSSEVSTLFTDVIYWKGKFFAVHYRGVIVVLDPAQDMAVTLEIPRPQSRLWRDTTYIVESSGALLQVHRKVELGDRDCVIKRIPYSTSTFRVFKLVDTSPNTTNIYDEIQNGQEIKSDEHTLKWMLLKHLRGRILFLGDNESISICASDYPGCKPNSIYFTDDYMDMYHYKPWNGPHDLGVFNLEDGIIENHYPTDHNTPIWPIPIWIRPSVRTTTTGKLMVKNEEAKLMVKNGEEEAATTIDFF